uniref:Exonuclease domain-containing protein n=1 Tax=Oryza punctata TaxID=4537 RepID=A0A0E0KXF3_ORYPU
MVFFDVETTAASGDHHQRQRVLEFGAIVVCPRRLVEVDSYHTLIRPADLSAVSKRFTIADDVDVASAPTFDQVADRIFGVLDGRVWAGHNIQRFDCHRIREAFAGIGRHPPEPMAIVDSLNVLAQEFGRRAGDLKMATLASYFGIGKQRHRSLDDARMNLEVLKHCATVLLLESTLPPGMLQGGCAGAVTRKRSNVAVAPATLKQISIAKPSSSSKRKQQRQGAQRPKAATTTAAKPCFHMILRHSRTILG